MPRCLTFSNDFTNEDGQTYVVFLGDLNDVDNCSSANNEEIIMLPIEYAVLAAQAEIGQQTSFDVEAYNIGYDGIIQSWVIGLGIGLILAVIAKLKR